MRKLTLLFGLLLLITGITQAQDDPTPYDIALERILEAERSGAIELDISHLDLLELPPEIGELVNLEWLNLAFNQLNTVPPEIGNLSNLATLWLDNNQLNNLPPEISNLSHLDILYLAKNQLTSLPAEIGTLSRLRVLNVDSNQLTTLPPEIGNLGRLELLSLSNNNLETLPAEIGKLTELCQLNLASNNFRHLPSTLGNLHGFEKESCAGAADWIRINLDGNPLISPPPEVVQQGTEAILDYLRNRARWHLQRLIIGMASGMGLLALIFWGLLTYRQRGQRKSKQKREDLS